MKKCRKDLKSFFIEIVSSYLFQQNYQITGFVQWSQLFVHTGSHKSCPRINKCFPECEAESCLCQTKSVNSCRRQL